MLDNRLSPSSQSSEPAARAMLLPVTDPTTAERSCFGMVGAQRRMVDGRNTPVAAPDPLPGGRSPEGSGLSLDVSRQATTATACQ